MVEVISLAALGLLLSMAWDKFTADREEDRTRELLAQLVADKQLTMLISDARDNILLTRAEMYGLVGRRTEEGFEFWIITDEGRAWLAAPPRKNKTK